MPLHYYIQSFGSKVDYEFKIEEQSLHGNGLLHLEANIGQEFPVSGFIIHVVHLSRRLHIFVVNIQCIQCMISFQEKTKFISKDLVDNHT